MARRGQGRAGARSGEPFDAEYHFGMIEKGEQRDSFDGMLSEPNLASQFDGKYRGPLHRIVAMTAASEEADVDECMQLTDAMTNHPKDRHVLAAQFAVRLKRSSPFNVKDFRPDSVNPCV